MMTGRRHFLALLPAALVAVRLQAQTGFFKGKPKRQTAAPQPLVYFGTDTAKPGAKGLYVARFNTATGQISTPAEAAASLRPAFMALNPKSYPAGGRAASGAAGRNQAASHRVMYVANEGDAKTSAISSYAVNVQTGALTLLGQTSSGGEGPCYVAVDGSGSSAYVANYAGGTVASYSVKPDGTLSEPVSRVDFHDREVFGSHGPVAERQTGPHPHSAMLSPDNRFLIVNDLGSDRIATFPIDPASGRLGAPRVFGNIAPGSGPRHVAFHPNGRWAYGIDELANRIDQYLWTATHTSPGVTAEALLTSAGHSVSTVDAGFRGTSTAAELAFGPDGNFLYASNRGENSLVVFAVDGTTGALKVVQRIACGGRTPRHFTLDPTAKWLVCGNQDSASVTVFARNPGDGLLRGPVQTLAIESPMYTLFV